MDSTIRQHALTKLAYFGYTGVYGAPAYPPPPMTVGQVLYRANSPVVPLSPMDRRRITDQINNTNMHVNAPAKSLFKAGLGALAGNFLATTLKLGPFMRGMATAAGANYGYNH